MRKRNSTKSIVVGVVFAIAAVAAGAFIAVKGPLSKSPMEPQTTKPSSNVVRQTVYPRVKIFLLKVVGDDIYLAPEVVKIKSGKELHKAAIEELLETNRWEGESKNLIPQGTTLLSLDVNQDVATINLSREFVDNFNGGARLEALTIHSIVHTLTQFDDVKSVRFLVEGEKLETLGGHLDTSGLIKADHTLLSEGND